MIFAGAQSEEPTGAISSGADEAAPAAAETSVAEANQTEPAPPASSSAPSDPELLTSPVLRPGSDGPLTRKDAVKPSAAAPAAEPRAPEPDKTEEKLQSQKPAATLEAPGTSPNANKSTPSKMASLTEPVPLAQGRYFLQVAAYNQKDSADKGLSAFSAKFPELLNTAPLFIETASVPGKGTVYRLRAGPFDSANAAETACRSLSAQGQDCLVVPPRRTAQN